MGKQDKKADQIVDETMKEIAEDLEKEDAFADDDEFEDEDYFYDEDDPEEEASGESIEPEEGEEAEEDEEPEEDEEAEDDGEPEDEEEEDGFDDEEDEEEPEEIEEEKAAKKKKRKKVALITLGSILGALVLIYAGFAFYFQSHFLFNTKINGTSFSLKSVSQVEDYMEQQVKDYVLTLQESDGGSEQIAGSDISLKYVPGDELKKLAKNQESLLWITSLWDAPEIEAKVGVEYDEEALKEQIAALQCLVPENQTASVDARPEFQTDKFVITEEVIGTQIDTEAFNKAVTEAINGFQSTLDLTEAGCYILPRFTSESEEVKAATDAMNSYLGATVTYDFNPYTEVVDASVISQWVTVDADMNVTFNQDAVKAYIQSLADKYNTKGKTRTITTATGNTVTVEGGSYGWKIDQEAEYNALTANIQNAEVVTREPAYTSRAASHEGNDFGSTFAEVDLTNQMVYFVQNGQVALSSPCVTGNPNNGHGTPQGVYSLAYKELDSVLRGEKLPDGSYEYESPVKYWMPFNGGIGFHDATWQPTFGGSRYLTGGSHGCVNMPYDAAGQLYNLISAGTPVVCHY